MPNRGPSTCSWRVELNFGTCFFSRRGLWNPTPSGQASAPSRRVSRPARARVGMVQASEGRAPSDWPLSADPRAHRNLWRAARLQLLPPRGWRLDAPCSLHAQATLCWQAPGRGPCQPLVPPLPRENVTVNVSEAAAPGVVEVRGGERGNLSVPLFPQMALEFPLLKGHPNLCVQVRRGHQSAGLGAGPGADPQRSHSALDPVYPRVPGAKWLPASSLGVPLRLYSNSAWDPGQVSPPL